MNDVWNAENIFYRVVDSNMTLQHDLGITFYELRLCTIWASAKSEGGITGLPQDIDEANTCLCMAITCGIPSLSRQTTEYPVNKHDA